MSFKGKCFSVEEEMKIIRRLEAGEPNVTVAKEFCVCHTTIATIKKNKEKIKILFDNNVFKPKRIRASTQEQVDKALLQWFIMQRRKKLIFSLNNCSASWISRFKVRNNIVAGEVIGESLSVEKINASEWLTKIWPTQRKDFNDEEIFNADETGLFYKLTPDKTLKFKVPDNLSDAVCLISEHSAPESK
ncbi:tigger transposable element-derived protein 6-like [Drosophila ficusphila]|uniref:tigger transposable element-derived protein 6-like n=1 Tax=Drosophila ficusphila TaxID=30025 RepID=UPI001C8937F4|nr:tigger transposable element-derived protein 6-like [Drosophila ficusphila]